MDNRETARRLDDDEVARVLRRALELDDPLSHPDRGIKPEALIAAAQEVGISPAAMRTALAEQRLGKRDESARWDQYVGERRPSAERQIYIAAPQLWLQIEAWMQRAQFEPRRRDAGGSIWNRRTDTIASLRRTASSMVGGTVFEGTNEMTIRVEPIGPQLTLVRIEADRTNHRRIAIGTAGGSAVGVLASGVGAIFDPAIAAAAIPALMIGAGSSVFALHGTKKLNTELERFLDRLAAGERPSVLGRPRRTRRLR